MNDIQKINKDIYNYKYQKLLDLILQLDYNKRIDINKIYEILENINNKDDRNIIIGEIYINKEDINKEIQIINSFENCKRKGNWKNKEDDYKYENEKEIKENIEIKIEGKKIEFSYYYKLEYSFKNNLTKTDYMFYDCNSLTNLNLSNFNTQNVTNMSDMFRGYDSLKKNNIITNDNKILNKFNN